MKPAPFYDAGGIQLFHGDVRELAPVVLAGEHVPCLLADPPYGVTKLEWDRWPDGWLATAAGIAPRGSLWCFGSLRLFMDRAAEFAGAGWQVSQDLVWEKHNGSSPHADRFRRVHEQVAHFWPRELAWGELYKAPVFTLDATARTIRRKGRPAHFGDLGAATFTVSDGGPRLQRSVIYAPSMHGEAENETEKPEATVAPLVEYSSPPGGLVVSMFAGAGTDLVVAKRLGRRAIGFELRREQCEVAVRRLAQEHLF